MKTDIIIPTFRKPKEVKPQIKEIKANTPEKHCILATCQPLSAAANRNWGLNYADSEIIIMMDDDITGFYPGWLGDLIKPLETRNAVVTARLYTKEKKLQIMMAFGVRLSTMGVIEITTELPSSCIAFKRSLSDQISNCDELPLNKPFDENYLKAEFEDTDFMKAAKIVQPDLKYLVNNNCKLIHLNEEKWRDESIRGVNKAYYNKKWRETR